MMTRREEGKELDGEWQTRSPRHLGHMSPPKVRPEELPAHVSLSRGGARFVAKVWRRCGS